MPNCSWPSKCYCRMRVLMGTTRMWSLCVLMLPPLTSTSLMDPSTWFSPTGFSCISLTKRYNIIFLSMRKQVSFFLKKNGFVLMQVELLVERMVGWIKVGGYIFFRESCFHQSGDSKRKSNPTHYREPRFYTKVLTFSELHFQIYQWNTEVHSRRGYACE